jgi:hypothetical protein
MNGSKKVVLRGVEKCAKEKTDILKIYPAMTGILLNCKEEGLTNSSMMLTGCFSVLNVVIPSVFFTQGQNIVLTVQVWQEDANLPAVLIATLNSLLIIICLKHLQELPPIISDQ